MKALQVKNGATTPLKVPTCNTPFLLITIVMALRCTAAEQQQPTSGPAEQQQPQRQLGSSSS
jgi:hypothetical protein